MEYLGVIVALYSRHFYDKVSNFWYGFIYFIYDIVNEMLRLFLTC